MAPTVPPRNTKRYVDTEKGYAMVEFSHPMGCYIWQCVLGHTAFDFESEAEALTDFKKHHCDLR